MRIMLLAGVLLTGVLAGCQTNVGQAATSGMDWVRSALRVQQDDPFDAVNKAVERACADLKLVQVAKSADLVKGEFVYFNATEEKITITTTRIDEKQTEILVQVGLLGDKRQSEVIINRIRKRL